MAATRKLLSARGITKRFPGILALEQVDFSLYAGEIHALMGENGAGKSTLIKVLTGVYRADGGTIDFDGSRVSPTSPRSAEAFGISTVYQEVNLVPSLSVAENIALGRQPTRWACIRWRAVKQHAREALGRLGLHLDVSQPLASFSIAIQQMVAIARALDVSAKLLILDEPTSSLDADETARLFAVLRSLKQDGMGILFVTHFLDQVYEVTDRITVLRNGRLVGAFETQSLPRAELIAHMMGRELADLETATPQAAAREEEARVPLIEVRGLARQGSIEAMDLSVACGEVLGLAGLLGSGRTETARLLFGIDTADDGEVEVDGKPALLKSPRSAIALGFGFCPEDRKTEALIPELSVRENIVLALQAKRGWLRAYSRAQQRAIAEQFIQTLNIVTSGPEQPVEGLSGGNQQKVILARWLASQPRLLILDEPTRGIDVGAKAEIQKLILELARKGMSILFISSELEEVVRCCARIAVLRDHLKVGELSAPDVDEQQILHVIAEK